MVATVQARDLIPFGSSWSYLMPLGLAEDPSLTDPDFETTWFRRDYSTTSPLSWSGPVAEPIEYGSIDAFNPDSQYLIREAQTVLEAPASADRYTTYFRREFTTTEAATGLAIELLADDGAKVYLDDREIAAVNCCQGILAGEVAPFEVFSLAVGSERTYLARRCDVRRVAGRGIDICWPWRYITRARPRRIWVSACACWTASLTRSWSKRARSGSISRDGKNLRTGRWRGRPQGLRTRPGAKGRRGSATIRVIPRRAADQYVSGRRGTGVVHHGLPATEVWCRQPG